jgi:hypothetical protein
MNKHILFVMDHLASPGKYTQEELKDNAASSAYAAADVYADAAADAADAAASAASAAAYSEKWVAKYFERKSENKQDYIDALTVKTEPVFTQEMADNGVLPSVGMECLILYSSSNYKGTITYIGKGVGVYHSKDNDKEYTFPLDSVSFKALKPLTPPITLEHGMGYQFTNIEDNTIHGIYDEDENSFRGTCVEWGANSCTNIQPLTVEVK